MAISANLNRVVGGLGLVVPIPRVVQQPVFFTIADTVMSESKPSSVGGLSQGAARHLRIVTCTLTWQYSRAFLAAVLFTIYICVLTKDFYVQAILHV